MNNIVSIYSKNLTSTYYLMPSSLCIAAIIYTTIDYQSVLVYFIVGSAINALLNLGINVAGNMLELNEFNDIPFSNHTFSNTAQGYGYILGFILIYFLYSKLQAHNDKKTNFTSSSRTSALFASIVLILLVFIIELFNAFTIRRDLTDDFKLPSIFAASFLGLLLGGIFSYIASLSEAQYHEDENIKHNNKVCRAFKDGTVIGNLQ